MPRSRSARGLVTLATFVAAAAAPAPAAAEGVMSEYQRLAERNLPRAPLVFTTAPAAVRPIGGAVQLGGARRRGGYLLRIARDEAGGPAVVALEGGGYASMRQARADFVRGQGYRARATRVRGHAGLALTRKGPPTSYALLWREDGVVYWLGTGTGRRISLAALRATARGLDRLENDWAGSGPDPDLETGAVMLTTTRTITGNVSWSANCTAPDGSPSTGYAGSASVTLLPLAGNRFAFDLAGLDTGSLRWSGRVSGTVGADAVMLTVRATGTFNGSKCDTGDVPVRLTRPPRG